MPEVVYFDDLAPGATYKSARRTVTEADVALFAGVSGDFNPLHTDEIFAREETPYGRRVAHGLLGVSIGSGLRSDLDTWLTLAYLEVRRRFPAGLFAGDTIHVEYEVAELRETRKPGRGVVTLNVRLVNQHGDVIQDGQDVLLVAARPKGEQ